ncbi:hypothetical protein Csa_023810, partial [Cucumis sativus]
GFLVFISILLYNFISALLLPPLHDLLLGFLVYQWKCI